MKAFIFCVCMLAAATQLTAQPKDTSFVCRLPEEQAEFPGGVIAMLKFINNNLAYPAELRETGRSGKVLTKFVVHEDGSLSNIEVVKPISDCAACSTEAIHVIERMPKWKPAKMNGRAVKCSYNLPVKFSMQ